MMMTSGMILSDSKHRSVSHWAYRVDPSPEDRGESCHIRYRRIQQRGVKVDRRRVPNPPHCANPANNVQTSMYLPLQHT